MVMFRDFVMRKARKLRITGHVENLRDNSVLVTAEGEELALKQFVEDLHKGPILSRVDVQMHAHTA